MKERIRLFGIVAFCWIVFFIISRLIFLLYHSGQTFDLKVSEIAKVLFLGLRMDLAMTGYWLLLTGLLLAMPIRNPRPVYYAHNIITTILLVVSVTIVTVDLELYSHWGFRMNTAPLFYFSSEAIGSVNPSRLAVLIILFILFTGACMLIYFRLIARRFLNLPALKSGYIPVMLLITGALFIPIRSSFSVAPINTGVVYFHKTKSFPNHAGINVVWNFFNTLSAKDNLKYPTGFFDGDTGATVRALEASGATPGSMLKLKKPDILLIIVESFTANIIEPLGGMKGITPNLNSLIQEGILFDHFYASGDRTDKGLIAVLSAYPAQPRTSIIRYPDKTRALPFLSRSLERKGYRTSFVYGGDIGFANMESYLNTGGFSHITEDDDFDSRLDNSKWGVADHYVFERLLAECDSARQPFFKVMLTLSSHEPFEVPMKPVFRGSDEKALFLNACFYTDKSLGAFIARARQQPWWDSTLVIITADHGHRFPNAGELKEKARFRIPMLWLGGALAKRDTLIHITGSQTDIANTLLGQLGATDDRFMFSKNLLSPDAKSFAFYSFQNGFGYVGDDGEYIYDFDSGSYSGKSGNEAVHKNGNALMQALFNDYNSR